MKHFKDCPIDKDIVILASGESLDDVLIPRLNEIAKKYFVIAINSQSIIQPHARIWSDENVTRWLETTNKDCIWITQHTAFHPKNQYDTLKKVDYWYDRRKENLNKNYRWTLWWLLELIHRHFEDKKVYIFGMDCHNTIRKRFVGNEMITEKHVDNNCIEMPEAFRTMKNIKPEFIKNLYNMNLTSKVTSIKYENIEKL
jgi:hypothetical protein